MTTQDQIRELYAAAAPRLVSQLFAITGDHAEAQDVVQDAFVRALARPGRFGEVEHPEAWLRTVALNIARSRYRRKAVFARLARSGRLDPERGRSAGLSPDHVALVAALQRLPRPAREAVVLYHIADLSVVDVAAALGCSVEAVKTRLVRARRALAADLDDTAHLTSVLPATVNEGGRRHA
ncbi:sigma-70 family RNA polymerase sigma factor [Micromonospora peucetia]|uniref:RNA polymerase sigma factor n=1 Tax=Micromonospora peucetia TaxID=47871 RepID=A0A1C6W4A5_9ACTN|nr:sigma-70 family RNA polymerase sigma factor [Micromonospora peucetia]MCX4390200.1 sigma-70 family RNA polymerase sigma factor [Micromonospora peucetia]WSA32489.1 sigma-70 family RNA polymerase sigma factor [Micromonospora peucetia]SCL73357.1 RNA polymerase sigma-70 factor, ECF subfamily [Micromonospora peucetia]